MLPSPSLGPPLLSASWSPPLPCGMGLAGWAGAVAGGAAGVLAAGCIGRAWWWWWCAAAGLAAAECVPAAGLGAEECAAAAVPQPAASTASSASPAAGRARVNDMTCPSALRTFAASGSGRPHCPPPGRLLPRQGGFAGGYGGCTGGRWAVSGRTDELGADGGARPMEGADDEGQ